MFGRKFFLSYQVSLSQFIRATPFAIGPKNEWLPIRHRHGQITSTFNNYSEKGKPNRTQKQTLSFGTANP
jgi:hypothetical protein